MAANINTEESIAWEAYDKAADELARKGLKGKIGDPLPLNMPVLAVQFINDDPEAFEQRVKASAYAQAMAGITDYSEVK